jgi:hypothetical protein
VPYPCGCGGAGNQTSLSHCECLWPLSFAYKGVQMGPTDPECSNELSDCISRRVKVVFLAGWVWGAALPHRRASLFFSVAEG